ncbi:MAG: 2-phospho-L-lactate transferase [Dehalococcoidia bacterium]|nr:2-phospho-L-lactate transferase [Dehalococcoidia bacterium]
MSENVVALAGGVGGAKLALGLSCLLNPEEFTLIVNTGDDDIFHGLYVCPDLDTVMYTLAGLSNTETGWGLSSESFKALSMLNRYGCDTWFNLGDLDLGTHIMRKYLLDKKHNLTEITAYLCQKLGVLCQVLPMTNDTVRTVIKTAGAELSMQQYFVRDKSEPEVLDIKYVGSDTAQPNEEFSNALDRVDKLIFCPSNPFLSIGPILALSGIRDRMMNLKKNNHLRIAVSPIVSGSSVKGPAGKIMHELGYEVSCVTVAELYRDVCDVFVIDVQDEKHCKDIESLGIKPLVAPIIMNSKADKIALAKTLLELEVI